MKRTLKKLWRRPKWREQLQACGGRHGLSNCSLKAREEPRGYQKLPRFLNRFWFFEAGGQVGAELEKRTESVWARELCLLRRCRLR